MEILSNQIHQKRKNYPEKILQFGTGVLLRGLPNYFIHKANEQGVFEGSVVVVKSTPGSVDKFTKQDGLFTHLLKGVKDGTYVEDTFVNEALSRVISARSDWNEILQTAHNPEIEIIISNTTEVGIQLVEESIHQNPPQSFPAKLTAYLYERFKAFEGNLEKGMVIVPTELISENGEKLQQIVGQLAKFNRLEKEFMDWLAEANYFCNSLVDRIVPGKPDPQSLEEIYNNQGYRDELLISSEIYALWAIQGNDQVKEKLSFAAVNEGMVITDDIEPFKERKLRLLNGTHTLSVPLAYLSDLNTVYEMMQNRQTEKFVQGLSLEEIAPTVPVEDFEYTQTFANEVLDRFRNPSIKHYLIDITLQVSTKMRMRNLATLMRYYQKFSKVPPRIALGFAAYLLFEKSIKKEADKCFAQRGDEFYLIRDDFASYYYEKWQNVEMDKLEQVKEFVRTVLADQKLWEEDLTQLPGFIQNVSDLLYEMLHRGVANTLKIFLEKY